MKHSKYNSVIGSLDKYYNFDRKSDIDSENKSAMVEIYEYQESVDLY